MTVAVIIVMASIVPILCYLYIRHIQKQARDGMAKKFEMREKEYTWRDIGIPEELSKEFEEFERYCKENGIDYRPMSREEEKKIIDEVVNELAKDWKNQSSSEPPPGFAEQVMEKIRAYENSLRKLHELKKDDVIRMADTEPWSNGASHDEIPDEHLFVVEGTLIEDRAIDVVIRQLSEDGSYDSKGKEIILADTLNGNKKVELVGQMNYDRTAMTYTLPRR